MGINWIIQTRITALNSICDHKRPSITVKHVLYMLYSDSWSFGVTYTDQGCHSRLNGLTPRPHFCLNTYMKYMFSGSQVIVAATIPMIETHTGCDCLGNCI